MHGRPHPTSSAPTCCWQPGSRGRWRWSLLRGQGAARWQGVLRPVRVQVRGGEGGGEGRRLAVGGVAAEGLTAWARAPSPGMTPPANHTSRAHYPCCCPGMGLGVVSTSHCCIPCRALPGDAEDCSGIQQCGHGASSGCPQPGMAFLLVFVSLSGCMAPWHPNPTRGTTALLIPTALTSIQRLTSPARLVQRVLPTQSEVYEMDSVSVRVGNEKWASQGNVVSCHGDSGA